MAVEVAEQAVASPPPMPRQRLALGATTISEHRVEEVQQVPSMAVQAVQVVTATTSIRDRVVGAAAVKTLGPEVLGALAVSLLAEEGAAEVGPLSAVPVVQVRAVKFAPGVILKMARYLIIRDKDGLVTNAVEWDGDTEKWQPPAEHSTLLSDKGNPGDTFDGSVFTPPVVIPPEQSRLDALIDLLATKVFKDALLSGAPVINPTEKDDLLKKQQP